MWNRHMRRDGVGYTAWGTQCGVHRVNEMDTTGTFRSLNDREFEGGGFGVD